MDSSSPSFFARHDFLIRRLHSICGLVPVGGFMVVHLTVNASVLLGVSVFIQNIYKIHSLGPLLTLVEWTFIFIPILFHATLGMVIILGGMPNTGNYPYAANRRYTLQRITGMLAFAFILIHVFHMHGWFHADIWLENVVKPLGGAQFKPFNAASTAGQALQGIAMVGIYLVGLLACVFHFANGIWTTGITWGVWTSPKAQARASKACLASGILLGALGLVALFGMRNVGSGEALQKAIKIENNSYLDKIESGELEPNEHKRTAPAEP